MRNSESLAPNAIEAEKAVLGSILSDPTSLYQVSPFLRPGDFYLIRHEWLYNLLLQMDEREQPIDLLTVTHEVVRLKAQDKIGDLYYLTELANGEFTPRNAFEYGRLVEIQSVRRKLMDAASRIAVLANSETLTTDEVIQQSEETLRGATERVSDAQMVDGAEQVARNLDEYLYWFGNPSDLRGLSTGIAGLDKQIGGMEPGLYSIGGATSMGKSTLAMQMMLAFARQGVGIAALTETSPRIAFHKMVGDLAGVTFKKMKAGRLTADEHKAVLDGYEVLRAVSSNIQVFDNSSPTLAAFRTEIRRTKNLAWIMVDSGSKLSGGLQQGGEGLREATNRVADFLEEISRDFPVVATWQFGRNAKDRDSKLPRLSDYKESGAVEENSDMCLGIFRPWYYIERGEMKPGPGDTPTSAKLLILKDRMGNSGDNVVDLNFVPGRGFFETDKRIAPTNGYHPSPRDAADPDRF